MKKRWYSPRTSTRRKLAPASYISKADAIARGLFTYFDGMHCTKGHLAAKYVIGDKCVHCHRLETRKSFLESR